jgi:hypothetical protein
MARDIPFSQSIHLSCELPAQLEIVSPRAISFALYPGGKMYGLIFGETVQFSEKRSAFFFNIPPR